MKIVSVLMLVLLLASTTVLGCINSPATPTPAPTVAPTPTPTPTVMPTVTTAPVTSHIYMPNETTNGRTYPSATITPINNGSKPGGLTQGELGRQ